MSKADAGECMDPVMRWILLGIVFFGLTVSGVAIILTLLQLAAVLFGWWP